MAAWNAAWRAQALPELAARDWDLIVVGGGITGAGILREAARRGWRCLLVEQRDFAWGTSSRSSKMVHGGLRYIAKGQFGLTRDSVRERQRLLGEAPGLVDPLSFIMPHYQGGFPGPRVFGTLLSLYDALAGRRNHLFHRLEELRYLAPGLKEDRLLGGTRFQDAVTDDARLVMRVLGEARAEGGEALNGLKVIELDRRDGRVQGLVAEDRESGERFTFRSRAVALATGAWADALRQKHGSEHIRPLRGSHLLLPAWRLPVTHAFSFMHGQDKRPVFVFPWEGRPWSAPPTWITGKPWTMTLPSAAKSWSTCWPPARSSFLLRRSPLAMCAPPGPVYARWSAMARPRSSRRMKNASMRCGSNPGA